MATSQHAKTPLHMTYIVNYSLRKDANILPFHKARSFEIIADNIDEALMKAIKDGCEGNYKNVANILVSSFRPTETFKYAHMDRTSTGLIIKEINVATSQVIRSRTLDEFFNGVNQGSAKIKYYNI
jgi:hypothetical protein